MHWSPGTSRQGLRINPCPGLAPGKHCHCRQAAVCCQEPEGRGYAGSRGPRWTRAVCHHFPWGSAGGALGLERGVARVSSLVVALVFLLQGPAGVCLAGGRDLHQQQPRPPTPLNTESRTQGAELASGQCPPWQCCLSLLSWFLCL